MSQKFVTQSVLPPKVNFMNNLSENRIAILDYVWYWHRLDLTWFEFVPVWTLSSQDETSTTHRFQGELGRNYWWNWLVFLFSSLKVTHISCKLLLSSTIYLIFGVDNTRTQIIKIHFLFPNIVVLGLNITIKSKYQRLIIIDKCNPSFIIE